MKVAMLVVQGRPKGKCLRFPNGEYLIGRGVECHVRPNSPWVSRQHCLLFISETGVQVRDLGSTNGTLVNGVRILEEQRLRAGDRLQVGPLVLQLVDQTPPNTQVAPIKDATEAGVDDVSQTQADFDAMKLFRSEPHLGPQAH